MDSLESVTLNSQLSSFRFIPVSTDSNYSKYFSRPYQALQFTISDADVNASRWSVNWPDANTLAIFNGKLRGVSRFRSDIKAKLLVNATTSQSGIYRFYAIPAYNNYTRCWTALASSTSCLPHVDVNISCMRSAELHLPWVFPMGAQSNTNPLWEIGVLPLAKLRTGTGDNTASVSIWITHENFETYGSSGINTFQSGVNVKERKDNGYISRYLTKFSKMFNALQPIPIVGNYMPVMSKVSDSLASAARVWGLSAPYISKPPKRVVSYNNASYALGTEPFAGKMMNVVDTNMVPFFKKTGNSFDEMSIPYIASKYWYYATYTWNDTQDVGISLTPGGIPTTPTGFFVPYTGTGSTTSYAFSPLLILTRLAKAWKGGIKYRFNFAVTKMHTGRVVVVCGSKGLTNNETSYRKVVDISETPSFEFTVPFLHPHMLSPTQASNFLTVFVEEKLANPSVVSNTVDFTLEIAGADDFEIIGFRGDDYNGEINPALPRTGNFVFQSGCFADEYVPEDVIYDESTPLHFCGEKIVSLRPLCKAFHRRIGVTVTSAGAVSTIASVNPAAALTNRDQWIQSPAANSITTFITFTERLCSAYYGIFGGLRARAPIEPTAGSLVVKVTDNTLNVSDLGGVVQYLGPSEFGVPVQSPYFSHYPFAPPVNTPSATSATTTHNSGVLLFGKPIEENITQFTARADDFDAQFFLGWPIMSPTSYPV